MIQNYWIEVNKLEFMEYIIQEYDFIKMMLENRKTPTLKLFKTIYESNNNSNIVYQNRKTSLDKSEFISNRVAAGLCSIKLMNNHNEYLQLLNKFKERYIDKNDFENKYRYGIDEIIIRYLVPYFRNGYTRNKTNNNMLNSYLSKKSQTLKNKTLNNIKRKRTAINNNQRTFAIQFSNKGVNTCINVECNGTCDYRDDKYMSNCSLTNLIFGVKDATQFKNILDILDSQYGKIYNFIGTLLLENINTFPLNELPVMAILKSFDYKKKYCFIPNEFKHIMIPNELEDKNNDKNNNKNNDKSVIFVKVILDIESNYEQSVDNYLSNIGIAYSLNNFKPLIIYPKKIVLFDRIKNDKSIPIENIFSILSKHNLTFDIEKSMKKLKNSN